MYLNEKEMSTYSKVQGRQQTEESFKFLEPYSGRHRLSQSKGTSSVLRFVSPDLETKVKSHMEDVSMPTSLNPGDIEGHTKVTDTETVTSPKVVEYKYEKSINISERCISMKITDNKLFCTTKTSLLVYREDTGSLLSTVKFNFGFFFG